MAADAISARGPLPRTGWILLSSILVGATLSGIGIGLRAWPLCWVGVGLVAVILMLLVIADHVGV